MFVECEGNNFTGGKSPNNTNMIKQKKKKKWDLTWEKLQNLSFTDKNIFTSKGQKEFKQDCYGTQWRITEKEIS
jgi:hypothetical protein